LDTEVRQLGGVLGVNQIRDILIRRARLGEQIIRDRSNSLYQQKKAMRSLVVYIHWFCSKRRKIKRTQGRDVCACLLELVDLPPHGRRSKRRQVSR
jgi:hypothetical protein